jgi:hypothetical protein
MYSCGKGKKGEIKATKAKEGKIISEKGREPYHENVGPFS